jgi:hypothetical protein
MTVTPLRQVSSSAASGTTLTVTFTEPTPLDASHLLVAMAGASASAGMEASGWTLVATTTPPVRVSRMWVKQGDGVTNSVTITTAASGAKRVILTAFAGFDSLTPIATAAAVLASSPETLALASTPAGYGVVLAGVYIAGGLTLPTSWTNGFAQLSAAVATNPGIVGGWAEYSSAPSSTDLTWTGGAQGAWTMAIMPLDSGSSPIGYALGSTPRTLALGSTPVEAWKGAGAP